MIFHYEDFILSKPILIFIIHQALSYITQSFIYAFFCSDFFHKYFSYFPQLVFCFGKLRFFIFSINFHVLQFSLQILPFIFQIHFLNFFSKVQDPQVFFCNPNHFLGALYLNFLFLLCSFLLSCQVLVLFYLFLTVNFIYIFLFDQWHDSDLAHLTIYNLTLHVLYTCLNSYTLYKDL